MSVGSALRQVPTVGSRHVCCTPVSNDETAEHGPAGRSHRRFESLNIRPPFARFPMHATQASIPGSVRALAVGPSASEAAGGEEPRRGRRRSAPPRKQRRSQPQPLGARRPFGQRLGKSELSRYPVRRVWFESTSESGPTCRAGLTTGSRRPSILPSASPSSLGGVARLSPAGVRVPSPSGEGVPFASHLGASQFRPRWQEAIRCW